MSADTERPARTLYHDAIVAAARRASGAGHLEQPDASVTLDNPLCGDRVSIDVRLHAGALSALAHRVKGCLLCEAAAGVIAEHAAGASAADLAAVHREVAALLAGGGGQSLAWPALEMFAPVGRYRSRHECVLLAFEALDRAMAEAASRPGVGA